MASSTDTLRAKVTASRQKTDEAKASLAANKSENAVLSTLTRLKEQGRIKGFHVSCELFL
jgi:structural maintenance of chromosome 4